jgi:ABC-type Fe3+ transport system permease subunit
MAPPKRKAGGRVTPKGTRPGQLPTAPVTSSASDARPHRASEASSRYTPPTHRASQMPSPRWVPILMFALLILGALVIIFNYLNVLLPGTVSNWYLLVGLGFILGGIVTATQYR